MAASTITRTEQVLAAARDNLRAATDLEIERLLLAIEWVQLHPGGEPDPEVEWAMRPLELAGDGAPTVDESAAAEFALAIGMKHEPGLRYLADAIELCHRLPRLWGRVLAGEVAVWKARRVAEATKNLPMDAAAHVDRHLALVAHACSFAEIERQVERARAEYDPAETERRRLAAAEQRHLTVHHRAATPEGLVPIEGLVDLADALAFDQLLTTKAATLDPGLPLEVRRSMALGRLGGGDAGGEVDRQVVIYTHTRPGRATVDVEHTRSVVTPDQVREWCQHAGTKVTIRPVLDLATELTTEVHDPTPTMREQAWLRHPTCVYPHCERPSRSCDLDHRVPYPAGATTTSNLYPLCRTHHRLKTTGNWTYRPLDLHTTLDWTSPLQITYRRHSR